VSPGGRDPVELGELDALGLLDGFSVSRRPPRELRTFADGLRVVQPKRLHRPKVRTLPEPGGPVHAARAGASTSLCGRELESMLEVPRRRFPFESYDVDATCGGCAEAAGMLRRWAG